MYPRCLGESLFIYSQQTVQHPHPPPPVISPVCLGGPVHFTANTLKPRYAAIVILIVKQKVAIHLLTLSHKASFALAHIQT